MKKNMSCWSNCFPLPQNPVLFFFIQNDHLSSQWHALDFFDFRYIQIIIQSSLMLKINEQLLKQTKKDQNKVLKNTSRAKIKMKF